MAKQDGKTNPFDGSGGGSSAGWGIQQAFTSRPPMAPGSLPRSDVPTGGEMPFVTPTSPPGNPIGAGSQGVSAPLPVKFTGG